jgi:CheY-like chemotaxis protein
MMGGSIAVSSTVGEGSTFTVTIPEIAAHPDQPKSRAEIPIGRLVLLIDDDPDIQDLVSRSLMKRGFAVQCATTGEEGVRMAQSFAPDIVVLDVKLPGMNGWEVLGQLKLDESTAHVPVIMMTILEEREVGHSLGAVDYLVKPVESEQLIGALLRHVPRDRANVMVVEDDESTRELIRRTLEGAGHWVVEAVNGADALSKLEHQIPDLIVLDLMMPVMDGFQFLHNLRQESRLSHVPVLVATARTLSDSERSELEALVKNIIEKNAFTRQQLLAQIEALVEAAVQKPSEDT